MEQGTRHELDSGFGSRDARARPTRATVLRAIRDFQSDESVVLAVVRDRRPFGVNFDWHVVLDFITPHQ